MSGRGRSLAIIFAALLSQGCLIYPDLPPPEDAERFVTPTHRVWSTVSTERQDRILPLITPVTRRLARQFEVRLPPDPDMRLYVLRDQAELQRVVPYDDPDAPDERLGNYIPAPYDLAVTTFSGSAELDRQRRDYALMAAELRLLLQQITVNPTPYGVSERHRARLVRQCLETIAHMDDRPDPADRALFEADDLTVLVHELAHQVAARAEEREALPKWLREGIAEYASHTSLGPQDVARPIWNSLGDLELRARYRSALALSTRALFGPLLAGSGPDPGLVPVWGEDDYAEHRGLVIYLVEVRGYTLAQLARGEFELGRDDGEDLARWARLALTEQQHDPSEWTDVMVAMWGVPDANPVAPGERAALERMLPTAFPMQLARRGGDRGVRQRRLSHARRALRQLAERTFARSWVETVLGPAELETAGERAASSGQAAQRSR